MNMSQDDIPPKSPWKGILKNSGAPKRRTGAPTAGAFVVDIQPISAQNVRVINVQPVTADKCEEVPNDQRNIDKKPVSSDVKPYVGPPSSHVACSCT